jgi:hypothetical protein
MAGTRGTHERHGKDIDPVYGYLRPDGRHGRTQLQRQQCALCHAFRQGYRQRTRLLAGYDPSTLLMLVEALCDQPPAPVRVGCPLPPFRRRTATDPAWPAARAVAALQLFLAGEKLFDDRLDRDSVLAGLTERALRSDVTRAEADLRALGADVDGLRAVLRAQADLERDPRADLDTLSRPTREALAQVARLAARTGGCDDAAVDAAGAFAADLGGVIYLVDALDDLPRDLARGVFNPLAHLATDLTPHALHTLLGLLAGRLSALWRSFEALPLRRHRDALSATLASLERRGRQALEALPAPRTTLRLAGVIP